MNHSLKSKTTLKPKLKPMTLGLLSLLGILTLALSATSTFAQDSILNRPFAAQIGENVKVGRPYHLTWPNTLKLHNGAVLTDQWGEKPLLYISGSGDLLHLTQNVTLVDHPYYRYEQTKYLTYKSEENAEFKKEFLGHAPNGSDVPKSNSNLDGAPPLHGFSNKALADLAQTRKIFRVSPSFAFYVAGNQVACTTYLNDYLDFRSKGNEFNFTSYGNSVEEAFEKAVASLQLAPGTLKRLGELQDAGIHPSFSFQKGEGVNLGQLNVWSSYSERFGQYGTSNVSSQTVGPTFSKTMTKLIHSLYKEKRPDLKLRSAIRYAEGHDNAATQNEFVQSLAKAKQSGKGSETMLLFWLSEGLKADAGYRPGEGPVDPAAVNAEIEKKVKAVEDRMTSGQTQATSGTQARSAQ